MTACPVCRARVRARADGTAGKHDFIAWKAPGVRAYWHTCKGVGLPTIDIPAQVGGPREGAGRRPVGPVALSERVTVLLSSPELATVDQERGPLTRSEWLAIKAGLRAPVR